MSVVRTMLSPWGPEQMSNLQILVATPPPGLGKRSSTGPRRFAMTNRTEMSLCWLLQAAMRATVKVGAREGDWDLLAWEVETNFSRERVDLGLSYIRSRAKDHLTPAECGWIANEVTLVHRGLRRASEDIWSMTEDTLRWSKNGWPSCLILWRGDGEVDLGGGRREQAQLMVDGGRVRWELTGALWSTLTGVATCAVVNKGWSPRPTGRMVSEETLSHIERRSRSTVGIRRQREPWSRVGRAPKFVVGGPRATSAP